MAVPTKDRIDADQTFGSGNRRFLIVRVLLLHIGLFASAAGHAQPPSSTSNQSSPKKTNSHAGSTPALIQRCLLAYQNKKYTSALSCLKKLIRKTGPNKDLLYALGYTTYQLRRYSQSARYFGDAAKITPKDGDTSFMQALVALRRERYNQAARLFHRALTLGMKEEDPREARRYLKLLAKLRRTKTKTGWSLTTAASAGYDSRPRLSGAAFDARTHTWTATAGSAFLSSLLKVGYRFHPARVLMGDVRFLFSQRTVFSDLEKNPTVQPRLHQSEVPPPSSQQVFRLGYTQTFKKDNFFTALTAAGFFELSGLDPPKPFFIGLKTVLHAGYAWKPYTTTLLWVGSRPRRALTDLYAHLTGYDVFTGVGERFKWKNRFFVLPSYRFSVRRLKTMELNWRDCPANETCVLEAPYDAKAHEIQLTVTAHLHSRVQLDLGSLVGWQRFDKPSTYRLSGGMIVRKRRQDFFHQHTMDLSVRIVSGLKLTATYLFEQNRSNIEEKTTDIGESYTRHLFCAGIEYIRP